jgi:N-acetylmuramoyl-L-alanine amidase
MGSRYLTDLADVVRAAGLVVQEEPGWQTRARSSGGYSGGLPNHVMIHHTASGPSSDGQPDVNYMCYSADARPVANLYLSRTGKVWIMAAGATNTNGSGGDPCGTIAPDSMNSSAIGIEAGNDGTGEAWPDAQQDAYLALTGRLCDAYAIPVGRIHSHAEWAPGRKIDPAGPSRWAASGTWDEDAFRADVTEPVPPQPPPPAWRKVAVMYTLMVDEIGANYATDSVSIRWIQTPDDLAWYKWMLTKFGFTTDIPGIVTQEQIKRHAFGTPQGPMPWGAGVTAEGFSAEGFSDSS